MKYTQETSAPQEDFMKFSDLYNACRKRWMWFVGSLALCLSAAFLYVRYTPLLYVRTASILLTDLSQGKDSKNGIFSDIATVGQINSNTDIQDEMIALTSPLVVEDVVRRLSLNVEHEQADEPRQSVIYGAELPFCVRLDDADASKAGTFLLTKKQNGEFTLTSFATADDEFDRTQTVRIGAHVSTPLGRLTVVPNAAYEGRVPQEWACRVRLSTLDATVAAVTSQLKVELKSDKSSVINIAYTDNSWRRAEDVVNGLIAAYNDQCKQRHATVAAVTSQFIVDRIQSFEKDLGQVDDDISAFKSRNLVPDVNAASGMYMAEEKQQRDELTELMMRQSMADYMRIYVEQRLGMKSFALLPANTGIENTNIESQIAEYNTLALEYAGLATPGNEANPRIVDLQQLLNVKQRALLSSLRNLHTLLGKQIKEQQANQHETQQKIASSPLQEKYLLTVERQQKVKEQLFLYLLQKREEIELAQTYGSSDVRIISRPSGSMAPIAPLSRPIYLLALAIGLVVPIVVILCIELFDSSVRGASDVQKLKVPYLGSIPFYRQAKGLFAKWRAKPIDHILVEDGNRNYINEAFRMVRSNLEFILPHNAKCKVLMATSFGAGNGKTFVTLNLASSLAIKGKRVLIVDLDLRLASLSKFVQSPKEGISSYLNEETSHADAIIVKGTLHDNLDIIPVGVVPPNPTELLYSARLQTLLTLLRERYDYVFLDSTPYEIVADSAIVNQYVDQTLFIVRAGLTSRTQLQQVERLYEEKKLKNMSIVLNSAAVATYGYRKRSYGYGYGYGK